MRALATDQAMGDGSHLAEDIAEIDRKTGLWVDESSV